MLLAPSVIRYQIYHNAKEIADDWGLDYSNALFPLVLIFMSAEQIMLFIPQEAIENIYKAIEAERSHDNSTSESISQ